MLVKYQSEIEQSEARNILKYILKIRLTSINHHHQINIKFHPFCVVHFSFWFEFLFFPLNPPSIGAGTALVTCFAGTAGDGGAGGARGFSGGLVTSGG